MWLSLDHMECFHEPKNFSALPVSLPWAPLHPVTLVTADLFAVSTVLPFPRCCIFGIIWYVGGCYIQRQVLFLFLPHEGPHDFRGSFWGRKHLSSCQVHMGRYYNFGRKGYVFIFYLWLLLLLLLNWSQGEKNIRVIAALPSQAGLRTGMLTSPPHVLMGILVNLVQTTPLWWKLVWPSSTDRRMFFRVPIHRLHFYAICPPSLSWIFF